MSEQLGSGGQSNLDSPVKNNSWLREINKSQWKIAIGACLAWTVDAFDNVLFGFVMYSILTEFNTNTVMTGLISTCTLFASAIGGILFGYISDKVGRKKSLILSIMMYTVFTFLVGSSENIWFLLIFRVLTGFGLGGEWSAGATLVSETWPEKHRGKGLGIMQCGLSIGGIVAGLSAGPVIASVGWRYLFWCASIPGVLVALYIAFFIEESPLWLESRRLTNVPKAKKTEKVSLSKSGYLGTIMLGLIFTAFIMLSSWPVTNFVTAYYATPVAKGGLGIGTVISTQIQVPGLIGAMLGYLSFGFISDKIGRKKTFIAFIGCAGIFIPLSYIMIAHSLIPLYIICTILGGYFSTGLYVGLGSMLSEQFPTRFRGTAIGFCYNGGRGVGALGMFVSGALIPVVGYLKVLVGFSLVLWFAFITAFFLKDQTGIKFEAN